MIEKYFSEEFGLDINQTLTWEELNLSALKSNTTYNEYMDSVIFNKIGETYLN